MTNRMYLKTQTLNELLAGRSSTKIKVGTVVLKGLKELRQLLEAAEREPRQSSENDPQIFLDVYAATDQKTDKVRHSEHGELILNIKEQKKHKTPPSIQDPEAHNYSQTWDS